MSAERDYVYTSSTSSYVISLNVQSRTDRLNACNSAIITVALCTFYNYYREIIIITPCMATVVELFIS